MNAQLPDGHRRLRVNGRQSNLGPTHRDNQGVKREGSTNNGRDESSGGDYAPNRTCALTASGAKATEGAPGRARRVGCAVALRAVIPRVRFPRDRSSPNGHTRAILDPSPETGQVEQPSRGTSRDAFASSWAQADSKQLEVNSETRNVASRSAPVKRAGWSQQSTPKQFTMARNGSAKLSESSHHEMTGRGQQPSSRLPTYKR